MKLCSIYSCLTVKKYKNPPWETRVIVENNVASFFQDTVYNQFNWVKWVMITAMTGKILSVSIVHCTFHDCTKFRIFFKKYFDPIITDIKICEYDFYNK